MARRLGVRPATVTEWFTRGRRPTGANLARLARLLGVSVDWLLESPPAAPGETHWNARQASHYQRTVLTAMRHAAADGILESLFEATAAGASMTDVYDHVLGPALTDLGELWACGDLGVAEEHAASSATAAALARFEPRVARLGRGRALVTAVEGERHWLGAAMVAAALRAEGWRVLFLGGDLPVDEVVRAGAACDPDIVCLSAVMPEHLATVAVQIEALHDASSRARILVGGRTWHDQSADWRACGADGCGTSTAEAVALARQALPSGP